MALNPPVPGLTAPESGLRRIFYDAVSPAKVNLVVQPGDELEVSDEVAAQLLLASQQFKTEQVDKRAPAHTAEPEDDDTPDYTQTEAPAEPDPGEEPAETTKPRKRTVKKS